MMPLLINWDRRHTYLPKVPVDFAGPSYFGGQNNELVLCCGKGAQVNYFLSFHRSRCVCVWSWGHSYLGSRIRRSRAFHSCPSSWRWPDVYCLEPCGRRSLHVCSRKPRRCCAYLDPPPSQRRTAWRRANTNKRRRVPEVVVSLSDGLKHVREFTLLGWHAITFHSG